ncbi:LPS export ABC transporter periplasmic protein LptC [Alcanivorax sp. 1008]|uniref:LPS export ABC transporter periplasmic protein LptC n=1 Tax=Alcanivorax sp. 1008 TaxID=2816853 RepID=UPI001D940155|nr:LPS export ABC transporter periplasmic protein LptC [Alcanivorax sp. 1008]MCC1495222.1 LPS export ABC transporter periplasmic protein LptC [Alcanivorax sp. 1008]
MRQSFISIAAILLVGVLALMVLNELDHVGVRPGVDAASAPDIVLKGANLSTFDEQGKIQYRVLAERIEHSEFTSRTLLDAPQLELHGGGQYWQVNAGHGEVDQKNRTLLLYDAVEARLDGPSAVLLNTDRLLYHVREQRLELPGAVEIRHPGGQTRAGKLDADVAAGRLNMGQGVETRYVTDL